MSKLIVLGFVVLLLVLQTLADPCNTNSDCTSGMCDTIRGICVTNCSSSSQCSAPFGICGPQGFCVGCVNSSSCSSSVQTCDPALTLCVASTCSSSSDCAGTETPICFSGACIECQHNSDCSSGYVCLPNGQCFNPVVQPILECWNQDTSGNYIAYLSYNNTGSSTVTIPPGINNYFWGNVYPPVTPKLTTFQPGRQGIYPASPFTVELPPGAVVTWDLNGYTLTLNSTSGFANSQCPSTLTVYLTVSASSSAAIINDFTTLTNNIANISGLNSSQIALSVSGSASPFTVTVNVSGGMPLSIGQDVAALLNYPNVTGALSDSVITVTGISWPPIPTEQGASNPLPPTSPAAPTSPLSPGVIAAIVVVAFVVVAAVIIITIVVVRHKRRRPSKGKGKPTPAPPTTQPIPQAG
jgi:hypothetical protein